MNRLLAPALVLAGAVLLAVSAARIVSGQQAAECGDQPYAEAQVEGLPRLWLELATTSEQRSRGLMFRDSLPDDAGMLFIFERETRGAFWMRNTLIPLSIAFIRPDGRIVDIQDMQPRSDELHGPRAHYLYALEVNQGWYATNGVNVGDLFVFCLPG